MPSEPGDRADDCGWCTLVPTTAGWVRAVQVDCPAHGSAPVTGAEPMDAVWAAEAAALKEPEKPWVSPVHTTSADDMSVWAFLQKQISDAYAAGVAAGRTQAAADLPSGVEELLAWLARHGLSTTPGVGVVLAAVRADLLAEGTDHDT